MVKIIVEGERRWFEAHAVLTLCFPLKEDSARNTIWYNRGEGGFPKTAEHLYSGNQVMSYPIPVIFFDKQEQVFFTFWTSEKSDAPNIDFLM